MSLGEQPLRYLRVVLGVLQMACAAIAIVLLMTRGLDKLTTLLVALACCLTTISVLMFGGPRRGSGDPK